MTTTVETEAAHIVTLSRREEQLSSHLTYLAGAIASAAVDGETGTEVFKSLVGQYRDAREEHATVKAAFDKVLNG